MNEKFSPARSNAIRAGLIEHVEASARTRLNPGSSGWIPAALLVVGLVVGGAASVAAVTAIQNSEPSDGSSAVPAPPGVIPGQPIISMLGTATSISHSGTASVALPAAPTGATHVRVTLTCLNPGTTSFGFDSGGNNPSMTCSASDIDSSSNVTWQDFDLESSDTLFLGAADGVETLVTLQFLNYVPTAWGVTTDGETFGTAGDGAEPDLIAARGVDASGATIEGYARASDLSAFGPEWPDMPANPEEALRWQEERNEKYPNGWDIPLYASDGVTQIGTMHISN